MAYFNTTSLRGAALAKAIASASNQDEAVMAMFRVYRSLSPSMAWEIYGKRCPITSIRRSISELADSGALVKTGIQVPGIYKAVEHVWKLAA